MTFIEMLTKVYNIIDEVDEDEQIEIICKGALNEAYKSLCTKDIRLTTAYIPAINGVASLPNDLISIKKIKPELQNGDMKVGNNIITDKQVTFEVLYNYAREDLISDNDEPDLHVILQDSMVNYACYKYFQHRKRIDVANSFFEKYQQGIFDFENSIQNDIGCFVETIKRVW